MLHEWGRFDAFDSTFSAPRNAANPVAGVFN
jgi:hypothetical protein